MGYMTTNATKEDTAQSSRASQASLYTSIVGKAKRADLAEAELDGLKAELDDATARWQKWFGIAANAEVEWAATVHDLTAERGTLAAADQRVRDLHAPKGTPGWEFCDACNQNYPCPTIRALNGQVTP